VLRSKQESQSSLDLDFQRISSLNRRSSREVLREVSIEKDLELGGGGILNQIKLCKDELDLSLNFPKMLIIPLLQRILSVHQLSDQALSRRARDRIKPSCFNN
jgi:hypothetical protein